MRTGLLMRSEHTETKAKTETRDARPRPRLRPRPKNCYETETKNYKTETETSLVNSVAYESKTNRYAFVIDYIFEKINDE